MYEKINERVAVVAVFGDTYQDVRPFKIRWNGRDYVIKQVGYVHKYKEGKAVLHAFSATDGVNFFELVFNAEELSWLLGKVSDGHTA